jgi:hypothetical protein
VGRPTDWWPVSDTDPVPGDPETLAEFGGKMRNVAAAIEQMANTLPKLATSEEWNSEAGDEFRAKAQSVATTIGKAHPRFVAVATALGTGTTGSGYAGVLQSCQDEADAQIERVTGSSGSEEVRLRAWNQLLDTTGGLNPEYPVPKNGGSTSGAPRMPAGAYPAATPGNVPPDLPNCAGDDAEVTALKGTYNGALATLQSATVKITQAANEQITAAENAARMIQNVIDSDGLNNPSGWDSFLHDVESFYDNHVVGVLKMISEISGWIATACGIIAMVLACMGLAPLAAAFETLSLLATAVQLVCSLVLACTGHGGWLDVGLDVIALVTMGVGKGLIGTAAEDANGLTGVAKLYGEFEDEADLARDPANMLDPGGRGTQAAFSELSGSAGKEDLLPSDTIGQTSGRASIVSRAWAGMKTAFDARTAFGELGDSSNWKSLGTALANRRLASGLKTFASMGSPEIAESVEASEKALGQLNNLWIAKNAAVSIATSQTEFRVVQSIAVGTDLIVDKANLLGDIGLQKVRDWDAPFEASS